MRKLKTNVIIKKLLNNLDKHAGEDMKTIYTELVKILKGFSGKENIINIEDLKTDRDFLDVNIEAYSFLYCLANNISYTKNEHFKPLALNPPKLFDYLITYKLENYGDQVFNDFGFSIVDRLENGSIRIRQMTPEEKEIQSKLN